MTFSEFIAEYLSHQITPQKNRKGHLSQGEVDRLSRLLEPTDGD
jgi:hypothetical protein|tara:strand:- start:2164 stop:2295 length:132 start_codon:yes stop_codon:yes gene_type:complete